MDYSQAGQGSPSNNATPARHGRGLREWSDRAVANSSSARPSSACRWRRSAWSSRPAAARPARARAATAAASAPAASAPGSAPASAPASAAASGGIVGGTIRVACQRPKGALDPVAMVDLVELRDHRPVARVPVHAERRTPRTSRPAWPLSWTPDSDEQGLDLQAPPGRDLARRHAVHRRRRRRHDGAPGHRRQLGPQGRHRRRFGGRHRPEHGHLHAGRRERQLPVPRVGLQRPVADHAQGVRRRDDPRQGSPTGTGAVEARPSTTSRRAPRSSGTTPGGAARPRSTARNSRSSTTPGRWSPPTRAARSTPSSSSTSCRARRSSPTRTSRSSRRRPPTTARSGCAATRAQFADKRVRQAFALYDRSPGAHHAAVQGQGASSANDHVIAPFYPYFSDTVPQRAQNIDKAKSLLSAAGVTDLKVDAPVRPAQRDPGPRRPAPEPGRTGRDHDHAARAWTTAPSTAPSGARRRPRIRPARARPNSASSTTATAPTPDVFLNSAFKTQGVWNSSQYSSPAFDAAFTEFQAAVGVDAQKAACAKIEHDHERRRPGRDRRTSTTTCRATRRRSPASTRRALGQMFLSSASKTA